MHYDVVVVHYHEVGLKGRNRHFFERALTKNITRAIEGTGFLKVRERPGRVIISLAEEHAIDPLLSALGRVFGVSNFAPAVHVDAELGPITEAALELARSATFGTFAVRARKGNTSFEMSSQQVNEIVGKAICDQTGAGVNLDRPDWTCHIEIVADHAYLYFDRRFGPGGLPLGVSGKVMALLSGGIDSPVAAWEVAKRGASCELIHFHGQPYSDPSSVRQASQLAAHLERWLGQNRLWMIPFGDIQREIVTAAPQELRVVLYRRFMMRIAESLAEREGCQALVTGESLGQVASQTLQNIAVIDRTVERLPVLRPLIGRDKVEIVELARTIGTYEISITPHQDCCVLFTPKHVTTHASFEQLAEAESALDVDGLVEKGVANAELAWRPEK
ncbi:MAG: tRNA 4-thiouridine(8) synthase ThiI [Actinobacteria bacterium]|nr:tRNA 4-thiouridine(8) synthase ThiI [Actinomycetota bacterium]